MNNRNESGSVFTVLLASIAIAGALTAILYQTLSGPLASMVRVANKTEARTQLEADGNLLVIGAADCDGDGVPEPPEARAGEGGPQGGGFVPQDIGAALADPWGTEYGYCAWDLGASGCGAEKNRLRGGEDAAPGATVMAVISAGPDRRFETSCGEGGVTAGGDDVVRRYTYAELRAGGLAARVDALEKEVAALKKAP